MNLVTVEQVEINKKAHIILFLREGKSRVIKDISDYKSYFYIPNPNGNFKALKGETVSKIETETPQEVKNLRGQYETSYEADVHWNTRWLVDNCPKIDKVNLRIQYTDIEKEPVTNVIIAISVFDTYLNKDVSFVWREDLAETKVNKEYVFPKSGYKFLATIHYFNSPKKMLQEYVRFVQSTDPDLMTGWFFTKFDAKEIIQECQKFGVSPSGLSPIGRTYLLGEQVQKNDRNIRIKGRVLWDCLKAYASLQPQKLPDASLEAISQKILGEGKQKRTGTFAWMWQNDLDRLVEYNAKDSVLVYRINEKVHLLNYYDEVRRMFGVEWDILFQGSLVWDTYILREVHGKVVLPTKQHIKMEKFVGATVFEPLKKGLHKNIIVLDFRGLYPSIIITFNLSPETLVDQEHIDSTLRKIYKLPSGFMFYADPLGLFPKILMDIVAKRESAMKERDTYPYGTDEYEVFNNQQEGWKRFRNQLWGASAYDNFRLCTNGIPQSITFMERLVIGEVKKYLESLGYRVLYGDTDSVFLFAHTATAEEMNKEALDLTVKINSFCKNYIAETIGADSQLSIEVKKIYETLMISEAKSNKEKQAKKRYAGLLPDGHVDIVGFESKRSDNSQFSRDSQKNVIEILLKGKDLTKNIEKLKLYIEAQLQYLLGSNVDFGYIGITKGVKDLADYDPRLHPEGYRVDSPHRRACVYSNQYLGAHFGVGDKPRLIYVKQELLKRYPKTDVVAYNDSEDLPQEFKDAVDKSTMIQKCLVMKLEHILSTANLTWEMVSPILNEDGQSLYQSKLEDF